MKTKLNQNFFIEIKEVDKKNVKKVRDFCLQQIKTEYGYDYNPDWHLDIDSLKDENGMYYPSHSGKFYYVEKDKRVISTIGFRNLKFKATNFELFKNKFNKENVGSIWRTYTDKNYRNQGLASMLVKKVEKDAKLFNYAYIYLHTSWNKPESVLFWRNRGYQIFSEENNEDKTVHMYKEI